jgi:hypothetical protein
VPFAHVTARASPPAQYVPSAHSTQGEDLSPATICCVPGPHVLTALQEGAFCRVETWPAGQSVHTRSFISDGCVETNVPAGQSFQVSHFSALLTALNVIAPQAVQPRLLIASGALLTLSPGLQSTQGVHMAALLVVLNPVAQGSQMRFATADPCLTTKEPATH